MGHKAHHVYQSIIVFFVSLLIVTVNKNLPVGLVISSILCSTYGAVLMASVTILSKHDNQALLNFEFSGNLGKYIGKDPHRSKIANMFRKQSFVAVWGIIFIGLGAIYLMLSIVL